MNSGNNNNSTSHTTILKHRLLEFMRDASKLENFFDDETNNSESLVDGSDLNTFQSNHSSIDYTYKILDTLDNVASTGSYTDIFNTTDASYNFEPVSKKKRRASEFEIDEIVMEDGHKISEPPKRKLLYRSSTM